MDQIISYHCSTRNVFRKLVREIVVAFFVISLLHPFLSHTVPESLTFHAPLSFDLRRLLHISIHIPSILLHLHIETNSTCQLPTPARLREMPAAAPWLPMPLLPPPRPLLNINTPRSLQPTTRAPAHRPERPTPMILKHTSAFGTHRYQCSSRPPQPSLIQSRKGLSDLSINGNARLTLRSSPLKALGPALAPIPNRQLMPNTACMPISPGSVSNAETTAKLE